MSNFYLDVIKDRLYCDAKDSLSRRSAQTAIYTILDHLMRLLAPLLAFTSNEVWQAMPHGEGADKRHVISNDMPKPTRASLSARDEAVRWANLMALRDDVNKALELARAERLSASRSTPRSPSTSPTRRRPPGIPSKDADPRRAVHRQRALREREPRRGLGLHRDAGRHRQGRGQHPPEVPALLDALRRDWLRRRAPRTLPALCRRAARVSVPAV